MDENTQKIVDALGQLGKIVADTSSNAILADILEQLKDIYTATDNLKSK